MLIDSKQLQGFVQDIEMLRDLLRPSTSAQSSAKQAKSASGQAFAELLAEVEKSAHDTSVSQASPLVQQLLQANGLMNQDNLLPLGTVSVSSIPASPFDVRSWALSLGVRNL